jgi:hypothetical protein
MAEIRIESAVPEDDLGRRTLEEVIRKTLRDHVGTWRVSIRRAQTDPWWIVVLERADGDFKGTLLIDLREQTAAAISEAILVSLRGAV